jgi:putative phage-type endonuclease
MQDIDISLFQNAMKIKNVVQQYPGVEKDIIKKRSTQLKQFQKQLKHLLSIPKVEQKTEEWYAIRKNLVTASDFAQALGHGKFGTVKQFYQKKCEKVDDAAASKTNPFFKWGNMFEPVAISIYSHMHNGIHVHNFGLLQHPKYDFFGASPDGISDLGIMVEIKCPFKRKIIDGGEVPEQYAYQIQGQLDVCGLQECDYFECEFINLETEDAFLTMDSKYVGIIVEVAPETFEYSPIGDSKESILNWNLRFDPSYTRTMWYLNCFNKKRVYRDDVFLQENMPKLKKVWDNVLKYRQNRDAYEIEVLNEIKIETQKYQHQPFTLKGWSFIDQQDQ